MFCANMDGSEKYKLSVIGKFKNPRCFKGTTNLPVHYYSQRKAWMNTDLFYKWLDKFDDKYYRLGRKVLLFVDNISSHKEDITLKATTVKFFPPNTTSKLQPMDQGVIKTGKVHYRRMFVKRLIAEINAGDKDEFGKINLKDGIELLGRAWNCVTPETISNCFRKAGFKSEHAAAQTADDDVTAEDSIAADTEETRNIWDFVREEFNVPELDFMDYVSTDDAVATEGDLTVSEIAAEVSTASSLDGANVDQDLEDEEPAPKILTAPEAWSDFKGLKTISCLRNLIREPFALFRE